MSWGVRARALSAPGGGLAPKLRLRSKSSTAGKGVLAESLGVGVAGCGVGSLLWECGAGRSWRMACIVEADIYRRQR